MSQDLDWADHLPRDLLRCVASRLPIADFVRFSAVCTSWHSVAATSSPLAPLMPHLLIPGNGSDQGSAEHCHLLNLSDNALLRVPTLPEIRNMLFVGSQHGYLIMLDEFSNVSLLNPLTRSTIRLPAITTLSDFVKPVHDEFGRLVMYSYHHEKIWATYDSPHLLTLHEFRCNSIRKVVLSCSPSTGSRDYTVVAIFHFTGLILFIRPGENKWRLLEEDEKEFFEDVIYCDDKFLAVTKYDRIMELDLASDPPRKILVAKGFGEKAPRPDVRYLVVDIARDLLQVCRQGAFVGDGYFYKTNNFLIMKLDRKQNRWSPVKNLGKQSLFLGNSYSMALPAKETPGLKENCIYFTDDGRQIAPDFRNEEIRDVGIFNVEHGTTQICNPPLDLQLRWPPPVWVVPNLC